MADFRKTFGIDYIFDAQDNVSRVIDKIEQSISTLDSNLVSAGSGIDTAFQRIQSDLESFSGALQEVDRLADAFLEAPSTDTFVAAFESARSAGQSLEDELTRLEELKQQVMAEGGDVSGIQESIDELQKDYEALGETIDSLVAERLDNLVRAFIDTEDEAEQARIKLEALNDITATTGVTAEQAADFWEKSVAEIRNVIDAIDDADGPTDKLGGSFGSLKDILGEVIGKFNGSGGLINAATAAAKNIGGGLLKSVNAAAGSLGKGLAKAASAATGPIGAIIGLVAGTALTLGIKKLTEAIRKAIEFKKALREGMGAAVAESQNEIQRLDLLNTRLRESTKGSYDYNAAKKEIISTYGKYSANLEDEIEKVGDLSTVYDKLRASIISATVAKQRDALIEQTQDEYGEKMTESASKMLKKYQRKYGKEQGLEAFQSWQDAQLLGTEMSADAQWGANKRQAKRYGRTVDKLGDKIDTINALYRTSDTVTNLTVENAEDVAEGITEVTEAVETANTAFSKTKKQVEQTAEELAEEMERETAEVQERLVASVDKYADYAVDAIEDENERSLAAMKLAHSRKLEEMKQEQQDMKEAYQRYNELTKAEGVDKETGLTAEQAATIQQFGDLIDKQAEAFTKEEAKEAAKTFTSLLQEYRGFGAQYLSITEDYEKAKAELIAGKTEENKEEVEDALDVLDDRYRESLANLAQSLADSGKDLDFSRWVDQLADMSLMDLQIELQTKTDDLELLKELFPEETEEVQKLQAAVALLQEAIKGYKEEAVEATKKDKWTELAQVINFVKDSISEVGDAIGGEFGKAVKSIGQTISSMAQLANAAKELEENPTSMTAKFSVAATAIQGVAGIIGTIVNQVKASKEATEAWSDTIRQCAHEYALLQIESQKYQQRNMFGVENPYQKAIDSAKMYASAIEELQKAQFDLGKGEVQTGTKKVTDWSAVAKNAGYGATAGAAIGSIIPGIGTAIGTVVGGVIGAVVGGVTGLVTKKVVPVMESLSKQYGQLFDPDTYKLNPSLLADYDKLDDDTKKLVDNWDEIVKKTEEAKNAMKENFSSLAGDIGGQLSDALVKAFTDGDIYAAVDDFHQYTSDAIQNIIEQMIFSQAFGDLFDELEGKFNESFLGASADQNLVDDLIWFNEQYKKRLEDYNAMMTDAQDALGDLGFDLWSNTDERRSAAKRSSLGASQDSIDESNGRLTAIQGHTFSIMENVTAIRQQNEELRLRSTELLMEVMGIHNDTTRAGEILEDMSNQIRLVRNGVETIVDKGVTML